MGVEGATEAAERVSRTEDLGVPAVDTTECVLDPHMVAWFQVWHVTCRMMTMVVLLLFLSIVLLLFSLVLHACTCWVELERKDRNCCVDLPPHE